MKKGNKTGSDLHIFGCNLGARQKFLLFDGQRGWTDPTHWRSERAKQDSKKPKKPAKMIWSEQTPLAASSSRDARVAARYQ